VRPYNSSDVAAGLEQMGGKRVAQGMACNALLEAGLLGCLANGALQGRGVYGMAELPAAAWVYGEAGGREEILPAQFPRGVGEFYGQRIGQIDFPVAGSQVFRMEQADTFDLKAQSGDDRFGKGDDAILFALAIPNSDRFVFKIHILDGQADAFHPAQAGAVEQLGHEFESAAEMLQQGEDFLAGEDRGQALWAFGGGKEDGFDLFVKDLPVQEKDSAQGLVLGGGGDVSFLGQVSEEGADLWGAHLSRMAFIVEQDETPHPIHIGLLGAVRIMFEAQFFAQLVEKFLCHLDILRKWVYNPIKNLRFRWYVAGIIARF